MKLSTIALKNLKCNFSFYALYLFSVSFVLMIFFCFTSFAMNEVIMEKISEDGRVETMCSVISVLIMAFVIFYISYSNKFFMARRMKELGIYALLGYRKTAILRLLTFETFFICMGGLIVGVFFGSLLHKALTTGIVSLLNLAIDSSSIPFLNWEALGFSVVFVLVVLAALGLSNIKALWKATLMDMVRLEKKSEKPIGTHVVSAFIGVLFLGAGYALAADMVRGKESLWYCLGFSPMALLTMLLVVLGTVLVIFSFLPFVCQKIKDRGKLLYRENTIIVVPKFMHRIRSNAKSIVLIILMSGATLSILGATLLSVWYPIKALERIIPSALEFRIEDEAERTAAFKGLDQVVGGGQYQSYETKILKVTATSHHLPSEYDISADKGRKPGFECISRSDYISLMKLQGKDVPITPLKTEECILIKYRPDKEKEDVGSVYSLYVANKSLQNVMVKDTSLINPIGFGNSVGTLVVSDKVYQTLLSAEPESFSVVSIDGEGMVATEAAYGSLKKAMPNNEYLVSSWYRQDELVRENSATLLLICFVTIIFFVATGSILYFQNISSVTYDNSDYEIMKKMGYYDAMIKRVIRRQVQIYFLIPYVLGVLHSVFALICYKSALVDDLLGKSNAVLVPILFSIALFSVVYFIYYQITKKSCYKIVLKGK